MKRISAILLTLLLAATMLVGLVLPALAEDGDAVLLITSAGPTTYTVSYEDATYSASPDNADDSKVYYLTVTSDAPVEVLAKVTYTVDGKPFDGTSTPGSYTVTAHLPEGQFVDSTGNPVTELTATLTLTVSELSADIPGKPYAVLLLAPDGFATSASVKSLAADIPAEMLKKYAAADTMAFRVSGTKGGSYTILIPVSSTLFEGRVRKLTTSSLFRYADGKLTSLAKEGYTVTLKDGYYEVTGLSGDTEMTLAIAVKKACFPWWILLVIAIVLCVLFLYFLGRSKSEKAKEEAKKEEATAPAKEAGEKDAKEEKKE